MTVRVTNGVFLTVVIGVALVASGCSRLFAPSPDPAPSPPAEVRQLVPTFTPTAVDQAPPTATEAPPTVAVLPPAETPTEAPAEESSPDAVEEPTPEPTATPAPRGRLTIDAEQINVRLGPGTDYGLAGDASRGQEFEITGKTQAGDWWQVCCVNGQQVWVFAQLARAENTEDVPVVTDLPPRPVAQAPTPAPPPPAEPTPEPEPQVEAPPPAADPCANIGGDGCKFRVRNGPRFHPNGGTELKLQFMFIHSGDGGRPQGSYFVAMFKDGQKLPIGDGTRSLVDVRQEGVLGEYNYEYKVGLSDLPGNNVAGSYVLYVLDGNGERDSQDVQLTVPDGQGEVWIEFDQG